MSIDVLPLVEHALCDHFGQLPERAAMSFVGVEPIEVLRFEPIPGERAYLTLGTSRHPMVAASESIRGADGPRCELMLHLRQVDPPDLWRHLAVLAAAPAVEGVVYSDGMTIDLGTSLGDGTRCTGAVVVSSAIAEIETPVGAVQILQLIPATHNELAWARVHGSPALRERWIAQKTDLLDLARASVELV